MGMVIFKNKEKESEIPTLLYVNVNFNIHFALTGV